MADTTTTNLALVKPEVGASANSWGGKLNADLDALDALFPSGDLAVVHGGTGASTASAARANLGLVIGTDVAPVASPTFTGTPAAPTAAAGTNTTQLATTAFVQSALQALYPVGSVYINASVTTNPATLLGFGTWVEIGAGRVLVGQDAGDTAFDVMGETGGSKDAIVVSHTHAASSSTTGAHFHNYPKGGASSGPRNAVSIDTSTDQVYNQSTDLNPNRGTDIKGDHSHDITVNSAGSSGTNANLQPYVVVKMWQRTA